MILGFVFPWARRDHMVRLTRARSAECLQRVLNQLDPAKRGACQRLKRAIGRHAQDHLSWSNATDINFEFHATTVCFSTLVIFPHHARNIRRSDQNSDRSAGWCLLF